MCFKWHDHVGWASVKDATSGKVLLKRGAAACPWSIFGSSWVRELQALGHTPSVLELASAVEAAFHSDCLVEGSTKALSKRRAFASVPVGGEGPAACLPLDLVEEVCLLVDTGIDNEADLRAACAEGGEVYLHPQADIMLSGDEETDRTGDGTWTLDA